MNATASGPRVLVLAADPSGFVDPIRARLPGLEITACVSYAELDAALARVTPRVVLASRIGSAPFPREALLEAESVEWIQCASAGVDHLMPVGERVVVTSASGVHDEVLSDYVVCAVLTWNLHFATFVKEQREKHWRPRELTPARGQTMVVLGYGSIGRAAGAKARALGMRVVGVRRRAGDDPSVVGRHELPAVVSDADFLVVTVPRTAETTGLVDGSLLAAMKPGSVLVNISRGGIVDEDALVHALGSGPLAGAVLDVFDEEPLPPEHPLWSLDNVLVTPHTGDAVDWRKRVAELFCANLERFRRHEPLANSVDPARGY